VEVNVYVEEEGEEGEERGGETRRGRRRSRRGRPRRASDRKGRGRGRGRGGGGKERGEDQVGLSPNVSPRVDRPGGQEEEAAGEEGEKNPQQHKSLEEAWDPSRQGQEQGQGASGGCEGAEGRGPGAAGRQGRERERESSSPAL